MTKHLTSLISLIACALSLTACDDSSTISGSSSTLYGIFEVTSHTINTSTCDTLGAEIEPPLRAAMIATHRHNLPANGSNPLHGTFLQVTTCADLAACRAFKAAQTPTSYQIQGRTLDQGDDASGWFGTSQSAVQFGGGDCIGSYTERAFTSINTPTGGLARVHFEERTWPLSFPPKDGACDQADLKALAQQNPCERYEVIEATFIE